MTGVLLITLTDTETVIEIIIVATEIITEGTVIRIMLITVVMEIVVLFNVVPEQIVAELMEGQEQEQEAEQVVEQKVTSLVHVEVSQILVLQTPTEQILVLTDEEVAEQLEILEEE